MHLGLNVRCMAILWSAVLATAAYAQTAAPAKDKPAARAQAKPPAAAATPAAAPGAREGKGWRVGPPPAWVVAAPAPADGATRAPDGGSRREQLVDIQLNHALPAPQFFIRIRAVALDASALGSVSQPQIQFNPAFQKVVIHGAAVIRNGQRSERLGQARIEPMRREQRLEQQVIDGAETLLVVVNDVRVGEPVEVSYTVEGDNPLFEGKVGGGMQLAYEVPVDVLHHRIIAPASRPLQMRPLNTDLLPERSVEGPNQVLRLVRQQVAAQPSEPATPPWVKQVPSIDVSEWRNWAEVDAWAQRLFATPPQTPPAVAERAAAFRTSGLTGAALASEVLRIVQDEVRYLSVALGDSSHRPKPPQQTLIDLNGDCKDKVLLLNTLLRELGFDAKPALVSLQRQRGIGQFLPGHDLFDHVITRLELDGRTWWLDATINGQGLTLASRGQWPYGLALVVGAGQELTVVAEQDAALDRLDHEQRWDFSPPGAPARLQTTMRAHGFAAERWRGAVAGAGRARLAEAMAGGMARLLPGLKPQASSR
jgi:Domain of Unknown Function with PDB structure (DUF3857)